MSNTLHTFNTTFSLKEIEWGYNAEEHRETCTFKMLDPNLEDRSLEVSIPTCGKTNTPVIVTFWCGDEEHPVQKRLSIDLLAKGHPFKYEEHDSLEYVKTLKFSGTTEEGTVATITMNLDSPRTYSADLYDCEGRLAASHTHYVKGFHDMYERTRNSFEGIHSDVLQHLRANKNKNPLHLGNFDQMELTKVLDGGVVFECEWKKVFACGYAFGGFTFFDAPAPYNHQFKKGDITTVNTKTEEGFDTTNLIEVVAKTPEGKTVSIEFHLTPEAFTITGRHFEGITDSFTTCHIFQRRLRYAHCVIFLSKLFSELRAYF